MSEQPTPETDQIEKYDGFKMRDSVTTCGDESSSVYINVIHARQLERERDKARDAIRVLAEHGESEIQRITKERDEWSAMCGRYKQERDTLVQKLDAWQEIAEHLHHLVQHPAYGVDQAIRRMDVLEAYKHLKNGH